jgi:hypothetical protein
MGLSNAHIVGEEDHVELGAFGGLRKLAVVSDVDARVGLRFFVPPGRDMVSCWIEECSKSHFLLRNGHGVLRQAK